jgi:hypothetical protein
MHARTGIELDRGYMTPWVASFLYV